MAEAAAHKALEPLDVFVGAWSMTTSFAPNPADAPRARTTFEWLPGRRFLIQRWEVEHPDAPDGNAIVGRWEQSNDGSNWNHDFDLAYARAR
ncbi:MAG TPA: hypothetical protein VF486_19115 [Actinomycetes bacterium]